MSATDVLLCGRFGAPREAASEFLSGLDPKITSRFVYRRMRFSCGVLAVVLSAALALVGFYGIRYHRAQDLVAHSQLASTFTHPNGTECDVFYVRTKFRGNDLYWEYHTCLKNMYTVVPTEEMEEQLPYATDVYINRNGTTEHWTFGQKHRCWVRVYDEEKSQEVTQLCILPLLSTSAG